MFYGADSARSQGGCSQRIRFATLVAAPESYFPLRKHILFGENRAMRVFVKPGCPWCVDAVKYLRQNGFRFEEIDVLGDPEAFQEMISLSGQSLAPTMEFQGKILPDFGIPELEAFLQEHGITPEMTE